MFYISDSFTMAPDKFKTPLQEKTYESLKILDIEFERVDTDEVISMDECVRINEKLNMRMVKTLFLCNRQQTEFYMFITTAQKPFNSKEFSSTLGISRLSFAPANLMDEMLGTKIGAATIFSMLIDSDNKVQVVLDKDAIDEEWYGCSDGTTTGYMKIKTSDIIQKLLKYTKHTPTVINFMK